MIAKRIHRILELFEQISRIPRCSKNEEAVTRWFEDWALQHRWPSRRDPAPNGSAASFHPRRRWTSA